MSEQLNLNPKSGFSLRINSDQSPHGTLCLHAPTSNIKGKIAPFSEQKGKKATIHGNKTPAGKGYHDASTFEPMESR